MMGLGRVVADRRGFALLVVIVVLLLVSLLASQLIMEVRTELLTAANSRELVGGRLLAEGGVNIALFRLLDKPELGREPAEFGGAEFFLGRQYETVLPAGKIEYYAQDEYGKINLNAASVGLLNMFLKYQGLKPEEIAVVQDSLQDWRDPDNLTRLDGAEQEYYEKLEPPYVPRNGALEDPAEFFLLKGTESLRGRFDPYEVFTVLPSTPGIRLNFDSLSAPLVEFLVEGDPAKVEQYQQLRKETGKIPATQAQLLLGPERYALLRNYVGYSQKAGPFYSIVARGWPAKGSTLPEATGAAGTPTAAEPGAAVRVMVKLAKDSFSYLSWREGHL
ncbi:MAG: general secretion pathway protein GspK [Desulfobulbaceae bacterium]|nr:general secretion pathway protein GspK [Desulfobulbaceae bacterium]